MQYLWYLKGRNLSPVKFTDLGRWWGNDPQRKTQTEIDVMGVQDENTVLFGECKWTEQPVTAEVLDTLHYRSRLFHYSDVPLFVFARTGFTEECRKRAGTMGRVHLNYL